MSSGADSALETTLLQAQLLDTSDAVTVNSKTVSSFPYQERLQETEVRLLDSQGHGYYLPKRNGAIHVQKQKQTNGNSHGKMHSGNFAVAWIDHGSNVTDAEYEYMIRLAGPAGKPD